MIDGYRKAVIIDPRMDTPLILVRNIRNIAELLRNRDVPNVRAVLEYLKTKKVETYFGGSVLESPLFHGRREYTDIDLLAITPNNETKLDIIEALKKDEVNLSGREFRGLWIEGDIEYLGTEIDDRLQLIPTKRRFFSQSPIDLCLATREQFQRHFLTETQRQ